MSVYKLTKNIGRFKINPISIRYTNIQYAMVQLEISSGEGGQPSVHLNFCPSLKFCSTLVYLLGIDMVRWAISHLTTLLTTPLIVCMQFVFTESHTQGTLPPFQIPGLKLRVRINFTVKKNGVLESMYLFNTVIRSTVIQVPTYALIYILTGLLCI